MQHIKQEELIVQIDALKEQLLNLLTIWYKDQTEVLQQILFVYENVFGNIEVEIEEKEQNAKKLEQKYKILSNYSNGKNPVKRQSVEFIDKLLFKDKENSNKTYNRIDTFNRKDKYERLDPLPNDSVNISKLYRNIVKKLHPDIIQESNIFKLCWSNVQFCYQKQDIERLKMFYLILCSKYEKDIKKQDIDTLIKEIDELKKSIEKQNQDNAHLQKEEPYCFKDKLNDDKWIIDRKNELRHKLVQVNKRILHNNRLLRQIKIVD